MVIICSRTSRIFPMMLFTRLLKSFWRAGRVVCKFAACEITARLID